MFSLAWFTWKDDAKTLIWLKLPFMPIKNVQKLPNVVSVGTSCNRQAVHESLRKYEILLRLSITYLIFYLRLPCMNDHEFVLAIVIGVPLSNAKSTPTSRWQSAEHCGCIGQLPGVNVFKCINVKLGVAEKEHAGSAKSSRGTQRLKNNASLVSTLASSSHHFFSEIYSSLFPLALPLPVTPSPPSSPLLSLATLHSCALSLFVSCDSFLNFSPSFPSLYPRSAFHPPLPSFPSCIHHCTYLPFRHFFRPWRT